jgi:hypothetical protein
MNDVKSADLTAAPLVSRADRPVTFQIPADLVVYAALVGKTPEIDPSLADPMTAAAEARRENPWSPAVLSNYLREVCREKVLRINTPELAHWLRRQSVVARRRITETRARMIAGRSDRAA